MWLPFFLITLFLLSSKVEDKLFNKSPGVDFLRELKAGAHLLQVRVGQTLKANPSCSTLENAQPPRHTHTRVHT